MEPILTDALAHLEALVACDTRNPPRDITVDEHRGLFAYLRARVEPGFRTALFDHGQGQVSLLCARGKPRLLFNFHLDTVPAASGWFEDPLRLRVEKGRAYGLGAADVKGAAACMLAAISRSWGDVALLFTTDE